MSRIYMLKEGKLDPSHRHQLIGRRFGHIKVLADWTSTLRSENNRGSTWFCVCDCGREFVEFGCDLARNSHKRMFCGWYCSCRKGELRKLKDAHPREWNSWVSMIGRCAAKRGTSVYECYGALGIKVCRRWSGKRTGFKNFLADMGERPPGMTNDRINPRNSYTPKNCRWADAFTQAHNKRDSKPMTPEEEAIKRAEWEARTYDYEPEQVF